MIKTIRIYSRLHIRSFAFNGKIDLPHKNWYLISIHEGNNVLLDEKTKKIFKGMGRIGALSLDFWDVTEDVFDRVCDKHPDATLFKKSHAKKIIAFIDRAQKKSKDATLVIHCMAGISRSGAVGTFACDYCDLDYKEFLKSNPYIKANSYVLQLLRDVSGIKYDESHDGMDHDYDKKVELVKLF
jgi:predicted protein tyrosine phosphatase